jgi:transcription antitermination factor NusG
MATHDTFENCIRSNISISGQAQWYAIQTYPHNEQMVVTELQRKGIKTYLPLRTEQHQWTDRRKQIQLPLFACYVFVHGVASIPFNNTVIRTRRVIRILGGNQPVPIPEAELESIRILISSKEQFSPHTYLTIGQRVRIRGGCLNGLEGTLISHERFDTLVISTELIQHYVAVRVSGYDIELISNLTKMHNN